MSVASGKKRTDPLLASLSPIPHECTGAYRPSSTYRGFPKRDIYKGEVQVPSVNRHQFDNHNALYIDKYVYITFDISSLIDVTRKRLTMCFNARGKASQLGHRREGLLC